ncbi:MAG: mechanosensitive ion channel [Clostridia bacterium]|nr:mechanosensitive ion channel [Clostridia bacterium]
MNWQTTLHGILDTVIHWITTAGLRLIIALILLMISFKIINAVSRRIEKAGNTGKIDKTIAKVFAYTLKVGLKCVVAICLVGFVGIDTSGLAALVTSFGVCAGLAVNGALSNLAGGVLIILTRPFRVDDFIEAQGYSGTVEDIRITATKLRTADNKVVYIPNGTLSSGNIVNYSEKDTRRVDLTFSISYDNDFEKAKSILTDITAAHELILDDPAPTIRVSAHGQSSVDIVTRAWVNSADYWTVYHDLLETTKTAFDKEGISIPYNQLDVHVKHD